MPIVSGNVYFDSTLNNTGTAGIANVPVVLQNTTTNVGLVVLTDSNGFFQFNNVPAGTYRLVESWGFGGGVATPGNFSSATTISVPIGEDPPASAITSPPANTNLIQSVTRNTITPITITTSDVTGQIFRDGPYTEKPLVINDVTYIGSNIITAADNGTWGSLPAGTAVDTHPATAPYPGVVPGFTYTNTTPADGSYTVSNISNFFNQGFIADHTTGDETGRLEMVNGANPGSLFFTQTVNVLPNSFYQFSAWMINLTGGNLPALGYEIRTTGGTVLFSQDAAGVALTTPRTWLELGTFFNSGSNSQLVVNLVSRGAAGGGNDYAIDDISLIRAQINDIVTTQKTVSKSFANVGDTLDYTIVIRNTGNSTITNMTFVDTIPSGTTFTTGSVFINNTNFPALNPSAITFGTPPIPMTPGQVATVTFKVVVNTIPTINPIPNSATMNYAFAPQNGGTTVPNAVATNIVSTQVNNGDISSRKIVDKSYAAIGDTVTYTIVLANYGNTTSNNIILIDTIPTGTSFIIDSLTINNVTQPGANPAPPTGATIGNIAAGSVTTISFKVLVTTIPSPNPFVNNASFTYNFLVDPVTTTFKNSGVNTNSVSTTVNSAIISPSKIVDKAFANVGSVLTYTITLKNTGNVSVNTMNFIDTIPSGTSFNSGSVTINSTPFVSLTPTFTFTSPQVPLGPNGTITVSFKVTVTTIPNPNPIPNSASGTFTYTVDPSVANGGSGGYDSNIVTTQVKNANLGNAVKYVDKNYADCGDIITYTIAIPNIGNVTAQNILLKDTIPSGTVFVANSVTINNVQQSGANPQSGVTIPNIAPGATTTVTFKVQVQC